MYLTLDEASPFKNAA